MSSGFAVEGGRPVKTWTEGVLFEEEARKQIENIARMPFVWPYVAVMPDVHRGIGATVGSVIPTKGAVIPAAVGVDIGCGMMAVKLPIIADQLPDNLAAMRSAIEAVVPAGRTNSGKTGDRGAWGEVPPHHAQLWLSDLVDGHRKLIAKHPKLEHHAAINHLGTLGTGNHFVEVCLDEANFVWVMLHSGSRGIGNRFGTYFIELAKEDMRRWLINLPDVDLAYLPEGTEHFDDYVEAVTWAQRYAALNRQLMMFNAIGAISSVLGFEWLAPVTIEELSSKYEMAVNCHHNYLARENHFGQNVLVTRKGAVRARKDDFGIIPGSMGTRSYIVRGKGNEQSLQSCSHGAGRKMSRTEAKRVFTVEQHAKATEGVECDKTAETLDETPGSYKDIDAVMEAQSDLVEVVATLKGVLCVKGVSEEAPWKKKRAAP